jgi:hypothetical protein
MLLPASLAARLYFFRTQTCGDGSACLYLPVSVVVHEATNGIELLNLR